MESMARHHSTVTPLGRALVASGLTATRFAAMSGTNSRMLTEHLAGRIIPRPDQIAVYSDILGLDPKDLAYDCSDAPNTSDAPDTSDAPNTSDTSGVPGH